VHRRLTGEWKTNSGRSRRCRFHTATIPSGSFGAEAFLLYDATHNSGNCLGYQYVPISDNRSQTFGDQSRSVTDRPTVHRSSENAQNSFTFCPSASSLKFNQCESALSLQTARCLQSRIYTNRIIPYIIIIIAQSPLHYPG